MIGITKSDIGLAGDASKTAHGYLLNAIDSVNELMGEGSAKAHPELVIAVMKAASEDYMASMLGQRIAPALDEVASAVRDAGDAVRDAGDAVRAGLSE